MSRSVIAPAFCSLAALLVLGSPSAAAPVSEHSGTLVVNTVFNTSGQSPVLEATGVFAGCTSVTQLDSDNRFVRGTAVFSGLKQINCPDGTVVVAYTATFDKQLPGARGSWRAVGGTGAYEGVSGGGRLTGDDNSCDLMGSDGCVLDTYTGVLT